MLKTPKTVAGIIAALFPTTEKAVAEKLTQEEFNAFASETEELQNRLDAQASGNAAVAADLVAAQTELATANTSLATAQGELATAQAALATANSTIAELQPKATNWDAHKAALGGSAITEDSTNTKGGKPAGGSDLSAKDQAHLDSLTALKAKYPGLMADINVPTQE